jgi:uncharacterized protein YkwD
VRDDPACVLVSGRAIRALAPLIVAASMTAAPAAAAHHSRHRPVRHARRGCAHANVPATQAPARALRVAVLCLINERRAARGLPTLHASPPLNRSAQRWTNEMVSTGEFTHGSDFAARITAAGFSWSTAGENIATGFLTPRDVVEGWLRSTGHCQNILSPVYRDVGTGVSARGIPGFGAGTWTQDFALPRGESPLSRNWGPAKGCPY